MEVDKQLQDNLPTITAPGNPDVFQKRFQETWHFFTQIAEKCNNMNLLRTDTTFKQNIKRFNLAVYFEIRFQQIASKLEEELLTCNSFYGNDKRFKITITAKFWDAIVRCFDREIYLVFLADQFLRMSMLVLSRYLTWLTNHINNLDKNSSDTEVFIMNTLIDLETLKTLIGDETIIIEESVFKIFPKTTHHVLIELMKLNKNLLDKHEKNFQGVVTNMKYKECMTHLSKVESIPRLYRRTNRNFPQEASSYVVSAVEVLTKLNSTHEDINTTEIFCSTVNIIIEQTSCQ